jgi:hypothetical protein
MRAQLEQRNAQLEQCAADIRKLERSSKWKTGLAGVAGVAGIAGIAGSASQLYDCTKKLDQQTRLTKALVDMGTIRYDTVDDFNKSKLAEELQVVFAPDESTPAGRHRKTIEAQPEAGGIVSVFGPSEEGDEQQDYIKKLLKRGILKDEEGLKRVIDSAMFSAILAPAEGVHANMYAGEGIVIDVHAAKATWSDQCFFTFTVYFAEEVDLPPQHPFFDVAYLVKDDVMTSSNFGTVRVVPRTLAT